ncbi:hypothetical protein BD626DRAFT_486711 [Schizophyllum amplum]|uniref:Ribosomal protein L7Ae/L30e/S12e/Gadd45 domain-containing protein n=1 Tax=Schizophyllum amplum TaxID=97359 RepID=A0A550CMR6_9AGAR|nr:hypothetical protein BD626DRAFT_486711 [Auriculariopsis ampla]
MADKAVKTHTNVSNREKPQGKQRKDTQEKKTVFKSVLDNPYRIQWPKVPGNVQNLIFSHTISMLDGMSDYTTTVRSSSSKRKRAERVAAKEHAAKKRRLGQVSNVADADAQAMDTALDSPDASTSANAQGEAVTSCSPNGPPQPPPVHDHVIIGINNVTKRLEKQTERVRYPKPVTVKASSTEVAPEQPTLSSITPPDAPPLRLVLVCKADVDPPILIDHIPHLVAAHNSSTAAGAPIKLVCLPKGAELALADALGLRRVAVLAFDADAPRLSQLDDMLTSVPTLAAAWLACKPHVRSVPSKSTTIPTQLAAPAYIPTHVKQLRTTAPTDMRAAKEQRTRERKEVKERKREELKKQKEKEKEREEKERSRRAMGNIYGGFMGGYGSYLYAL